MTTDDSPFEAFTLRLPNQRRRRRITLAELTRSVHGYEWAAILTDAYLTKDGIDVFVGGFDELLGATDERDVPLLLDEVRRSGRFTEGARNLPKTIVDFMSRAGRSPFLVRSLDTLELKQITEQQLTHNIFTAVEVGANELELCDSGSTWYLRLRDDDPLIFLYADHALLGELKNSAPRNVQQLPQTFVYAY